MTQGRDGEGVSLYPNFPGKHQLSAYVNPEDTIRYARAHGDLDGYNPPDAIVITYQRSVLEHLLRSEDLDSEEPPRGFRGLITLPSTDHRIGVLAGFGFGAPVATFLLENFIALGTERFISVGTAGGLQPGCQPGDLILCNGAIRDEGVSHHYVESAKYAFPSPGLTSKMANTFDRASLAYSAGCSWTIDTPYRESMQEARHYQREGVLCVEMEASALFSVASFRSVQMACALVISDLLDEQVWQPQMKNRAATDGLNALYEAAVRTLHESL
jgi:uridine phosphorylase